MVNVSSVTNGTGNAFIMFNANHTSSYKRIAVYVRNTGGKAQFGLAETDTGTSLVWNTDTYDFNTTHLLVLKYDYSTKKGELFVNPPIQATEPAANVSVINTNEDWNTYGIRAITVRQRTSHSQKIGGLRFAQTWVDAIGYEGTTPVNLTGFTAKTQSNGSVNLNWSTASETGNDYFLIERSADGSNFSELEKIPSKGESGNYQYTDNQPFKGNNYYRLTQFDKDGKSEILGVKSVVFSLSALGSKVYPNPLKGNSLNIKLNKTVSEPVVITISNIAGKEIYTGTFTSSDINVELASKPAPGVYFVKAGAQQVFKLYVE